MTNSTKGLERRGRIYLERVGDYLMSYVRSAGSWRWDVNRRPVYITGGWSGRLRDARVLAATAVALQEERP